MVNLHRCAVLLELDITNFAVARHVRLRLDSGLIAITGETGAGKSILLDALGLLLGARADSDTVRVGERSARIEGVFLLSAAAREAVTPLLEQGIELDDETLIVSRDVPADGRSVARVNGRVAPQAMLGAIGRRLVDLHGQADHLALLRPAEQLAALDRYAGLAERRLDMARSVARLRETRALLQRGKEDERERARRIDRLTYEIGEIDAAGPEPGEDELLTAERRVLASAEELARLAEEARTALDEGAVDAIGRAQAAADAIARLDSRFADRAADATALQDAVADAVRVLRSYQEEIEFDPERLAVVEGRLLALGDLTRKYGPTIADVLVYVEAARAELVGVERSEEAAVALMEEETAQVARCAALAEELARSRAAAARELVRLAEGELHTLGLPSARFAVAFHRRDAADGLPVALPEAETVGADGVAAQGTVTAAAFDVTGVDAVEFVVAFNPREPLRPAGRVASGGEASRLMLALKTVLGAQDDVPTLVFDEVESGLGPRSGGIIGEKLAAIARGRQVLCITHLPQVAACADRHIVVRKALEDGRATVEVREIEGEERLAELAAMLGGNTAENRESARRMLAERAPSPREAAS